MALGRAGPDRRICLPFGRTPRPGSNGLAKPDSARDARGLELAADRGAAADGQSASFELDYEVDSIGSSGVAKVELWGTRDGGRHWTNFGADNDNRSPLVVTVDGEGVYGFRVVIQSGSGLSGQLPRDGDLPEVWIGVDLTRPSVRITAIEAGPEGGEIAVRWESSDALLENRPAALLFSDQPHGPWTPIALGLESNGSFDWRLDNRVPERIYLRLEARDQAGNVGTYETPEPVSINRQRPQGRIRGVRPLGQTPR